MNPKLQLAGKAAVVGGHALLEKIRPPQVATADDVPISGAHVTREWLTAVLCRDVPGAQVVSFSNPGGSSGTSERLALRVSYNDAGRGAGLPTDLFTKATTKFRQRLVLGGAGALEGETHFYTGLRAQATLEAPKGYWGNVDKKSWRSIAIMEDITATKGATFMEPTQGFTREQMTDLVGTLARLHGPLWGSPDIGMLKTPEDYLATTSIFLDIRKRSEVGMERAKDVMPAALLGQADRLFEGTLRSMRISSHDMPRTLLHGDAHAGQTYMTADGKMGLADWQAVLQGGWAFDFAYLVNSGCEPDDRRAWQQGLLKHYIDVLTTNGGPSLSYDDALLAYRQQSFWAYTAWAFTIGRASYQPEMQPVHTCLTIVRRTAAAIDDLESFAAVGV
jgi:aminoglycoside phosphotransferase (APT) family kinase protein